MLAVGTSEGHLLIYDIVTKEVNGNVAYPLVDLIGISY